MKSILTLAIMVALCGSALAGSISDTVAYADMHGNRVYTEPTDAAPQGAQTIQLRGPCEADWQALGPFGGDAQDVAMSPADANIVLAGIAPNGSSGGTLFRSTDGGASWTEVAAISGNSVFDIEFTPTGIAYIGTDNSVWKSTDGGAGWTQLNLNIGLNDVVRDCGDRSGE